MRATITEKSYGFVVTDSNNTRVCKRTVQSRAAEWCRANGYTELTFVSRANDLQSKATSSTPVNVMSSHVQELKPKKQFSVEKRFYFLSQLTKMIVNDAQKALVITGNAGIGKTYNVMRELKDAGMTDRADVLEEDQISDSVDYDYVTVKGRVTPKGLYKVLFDNKDKIVVFDDCDSVFSNITTANLLKAALDTYEKRIISWVSTQDDGLPDSFEFTGRVIFISNLSMNHMDKAVMSRSLKVDLTMTQQEVIDRMRTVVSALCPHVSVSDKLEVIDFLETIKDDINELNFRTLEQGIALQQEHSDWHDIVEYSSCMM